MATLIAAVAMLALPSPASAQGRTSRAPSRQVAASPPSRALARLEAGAALTRHEVLSRLRAGTRGCAGLLQSRFAPAHGQRCLHGLDTWIPDAEGHIGVSGEARVAPLPQFDDLPGIPCYSSGPRVHVFYAYFEKNLLDASRGQNRRGAILHAVAVADRILNVSAGQTGGARHLRWAMSRCHLLITPFRVARRWTFGAFDPTYLRFKLEHAHLMSKSEKGLTFLETATSPIPAGCQGVGELYDDDRASSTNIHNHGDFNTLVVTGCADALFDPFAMGEVSIHELFHSMGAVQVSSPNHTPGHHCTDESDVMCYNDDGRHHMRKVCPATVPELLDCNDNDYFNTGPKAGTYLATHWDTARNVFQAAGAPSKFQLLPKPKVTLKSPGAVVAGLVRITASAQRGLAPIRSVTFTVNGHKTVDFAAPYSISIQTLPEKGGYPNGTKLTIGAVVEDTYGMSGTAKPITVTVNNPTVDLTAPGWYQTVGGSVSWRAVAHAAKDIQSVQLFVNGVLKATDKQGPEYGGTVSLPASAGSQPMLMARITQVDGVSRTSAPRPLVRSSPSAVGVFPQSNFQFPRMEGPVTLFATAEGSPGMDIDHVTFRLLHAGKPIPDVHPIEVSQAPYEATWTPPSSFTGRVSVRVTATDEGGVSEDAFYEDLGLTVVKNSPETISLTSPPAADPPSSVSGQVAVQADPQPGPGRLVYRVDFYEDGRWIGQSLEVPWKLGDSDEGWNSLDVGNGPHVISATATTYDEDFTVEQTINTGGTVVIVDNDPAPIAEITSPSGGDHVSGSVTVSVHLTKPATHHAESVAFYANGLLLGWDETPTSGSFKRTWNTGPFGNGPVRLRAKSLISPEGGTAYSVWSAPVVVSVRH